MVTNVTTPTGAAQTAIDTGNPVINQSTANTPNWYDQLALQFGNAASGALDRTGATYGGPRIADFSALQNQAFGGATDASTAYKPGFEAGL